MIEVRKKEDEKPEALLRRFNRIIQDSGLLRTIKETRFRTKPPTRRERRETAQRKAMIRRLKSTYISK